MRLNSWTELKIWRMGEFDDWVRGGGDGAFYWMGGWLGLAWLDLA